MLGGGITVLLIKLLVLYIKIRIFFLKHDDDILGEIGIAVLKTIADAVSENTVGYTDEEPKGIN